jgi:asparagine synthase (glutamine-hydrolysing)
MCGICGIIYDDPRHPIDRELLARMNRTMLPRGPDEGGYSFGRGAGIAMRRLAIIDVADGHQPIHSERGDISAACNGEIYNYQELREGLLSRGHRFRTQADAEVLPHLYEERGVEMLSELRGMFGLCIWDETDRVLLLARDRMGKKPLYWSRRDGALFFGSELKALLAAIGRPPELSRAALAKYLAYGYIPAPHTIFTGIQKLEPGHALVFVRGAVSVRRYWDVPLAAEGPIPSAREAREELRRLLSLAVKRRLMSDVPLGVFLSGGIDSASIVAMMAEQCSPHEIKTFSIAFAERSFDESSYARRVAAHFGTDHRERRVSPDDLQALLPELADFLDEPFADASIVPTYALARFAREEVTVALGGDGGDELFAGYPTFQADIAARLYAHIPEVLRARAIEPCVRALPASDANVSFDFKLKQFIKGAMRPAPERHIAWLGPFVPEELVGLLVDALPARLYDDAWRHAMAIPSPLAGNGLLYLYQKLYLAEDILTKVDRASMAASLEVRAPFLDQELVEYVARLPYGMKLRGLTLKHLLKRAMGDLLPHGIARRAKKGFGLPMARWIRGPLRKAFENALAPEKLSQEGLFRRGAVQELLAQHLAGRADHSRKLWALFMFEQWLARWGSGRLQSAGASVTEG